MGKQQASDSKKESSATQLLSWIAITIGFRPNDEDEKDHENGYALLTPEYLSPQRHGKNKDGTLQKTHEGNIIHHYINEQDLINVPVVKYSTKASKLADLQEPELSFINKLKGLLNRSEDQQEQLVWYHGHTSESDTCGYGQQPHLHILIKTKDDFLQEKKWTQLLQQGQKVNLLYSVFRIKLPFDYIKKTKTDAFYFLGASTQQLLEDWKETPDCEDSHFEDFAEMVEKKIPDRGDFSGFFKKFAPKKRPADNPVDNKRKKQRSQ